MTLHNFKKDTALVTELLESKDLSDVDPLSLPVSFAASPELNFMSENDKEILFGGMLRRVVKRAILNVPYYRNHAFWKSINPSNITKLSDLKFLPIVSKDSIPGTGSQSTGGIRGFREAVNKDFSILCPTNVSELISVQEEANSNHEKILEKYNGKKLLHFSSGGSQGQSTITALSYLSIETESFALARCLRSNGFKSGQSIACFYAPHHKGGLQLQRAADIMGMNFHSKDKIFSSLEKNGTYSQALSELKQSKIDGDSKKIISSGKIVREGIREYIRKNNINVIESVQPPTMYVSKNTKGSELAFMNLYNEDPDSFKSVEHIFLTGFPVPEDAQEILRNNGKTVSTTWGSTETMALATHPLDWKSRGTNHLKSTPFPTIGLVARYKERGFSSPRIQEVNNGEKGILLVSSLLGVGSTYINFNIGDIATKVSGGFKDIGRISHNLDIGGSCAEDALNL
jgi:hypothetical protein